MTSQHPAVPAAARALASDLAALFTNDQEIAYRLNDAQTRLHSANERLWSGLHPDAHAMLYDETHAVRAPDVRSHSQVIAVMLDQLRGGANELQLRTAVLTTVVEIHSAVHRAFVDYQFASEERRQLAIEAGELGRRLVDALTTAGWTEPEARSANVHNLAEDRGHHVPC
jgi:hypothetical protein